MSRSIWAYLLSYSLSLLGNGIAMVIFPLLVLARTGDVLAAGVVAGVTAAVAAVTGMFAGVLIDRVNRRTVSIVSDTVSATSIATLPLVDALWGLNMTWFLALAVLGAIGDAPGLTARETLLPGLVRVTGERPGDLDRLVGIRESLAATLMLAGPGIGGVLVWLAGVGSTVLLVTAATSAFAAVLSLGIDHRAGMVEDFDATESPLIRTGVPGVFADLIVGWRFLVRDPLVASATIFTAAMVAAMVALQTTLLPAHFLDEDLPGLAGLMLAGLSLGALVGGGVYVATVGRVRRRIWLLTGMLGISVGFLTIGVMPAPWIILAAAVLIGLANGPISTVLGVATIGATPDRMRGRVLGAQNALILAAPALSTAPIAAAASRWGVQAAGVVLAMIVVVVACLAMLNPAFRALDDLPSANDPTTPDRSHEEHDNAVEHQRTGPTGSGQSPDDPALSRCRTTPGT